MLKEDTLQIELKKDHARLERKYLKEWGKIENAQYKNASQQIVKEVINDINSQNTDPITLEGRLDQVLSLFHDLSMAINDSDFSCTDWTDSEKRTLFYKDQNWDAGLKPWLDSPTIFIGSLNEIIRKYLSYKWLFSPTMEWFLVNAYLKYVTNKTRKDYLYAFPSSARSSAACCSTEKGYWTAYLIRKVIWITIFIYLFIICINDLEKNSYLSLIFLLFTDVTQPVEFVALNKLAVLPEGKFFLSMQNG